MREIRLSRGCAAVVDDADYELLSNHNWFVAPRGNTSYAVRYTARPHRRCVLMHREIMGVAAFDRRVEVDHIDRDGLNNCRSNLRLATRVQNSGNSLPRPGSSPFKGVMWCKQKLKWHAVITIDRKQRHLGFFAHEIDAAAAYDAAAKDRFGDFALLNLEGC